MTRLLEEALDAGAAGMSTGLYYAPGLFATTEEVIALAKVVARRGGYYASHIRNEAEGLLDALDEALTIGRASGVPVHISHLKAAGMRNWGKAEAAVAKLEAARREGLDVTCDVYPYHFSSTSLQAVIPPWALEGERSASSLASATRRRGRRSSPRSRTACPAGKTSITTPAGRRSSSRPSTQRPTPGCRVTAWPRPPPTRAPIRSSGPWTCWSPSGGR